MNFKHIAKEDGNWRVVVNPRLGSFEMEVWLVNVRDGKARIANVDKNGFLELKEIKKEDQTFPEKKHHPLMTVSQNVWQLIVDAITEETLPVKKEAVDAKLEAVSYHLEDMRKLVFNESKTEIKLSPDYLCGHGSCLPGKCNYKKEDK